MGRVQTAVGLNCCLFFFIIHVSSHTFTAEKINENFA